MKGSNEKKKNEIKSPVWPPQPCIFGDGVKDGVCATAATVKMHKKLQQTLVANDYRSS